MRDNRQLCVNETKAALVAGDAISEVARVLSDTSRALNVSRGFMDGIERDFFNAFEAIKGDPDKCVYGHSNQNDEVMSKRASEALRHFFFALATCAAADVQLRERCWKAASLRLLSHSTPSPQSACATE
ncbi:hypothetical protein ERJ75_001174400 [Trypanosoma vivax]|nr:hypothetical protein ERJ75_001174400 [Trypanosoma vivax]